MQRFIAARRQPIPDQASTIDIVMQGTSDLDLTAMLQNLSRTFNDDDELKVILPPLKLSRNEYQIQLKNGSTLQCQQEHTPEGVRQKIHLNTKYNSSATKQSAMEIDAKLFCALAMATLETAPTATAKEVYLEIKPANPERLKAMQDAFKQKGFTILDHPPAPKHRRQTP